MTFFIGFLNPVVENSEVVPNNLPPEYDCSDPCTFRDMTFSVIFSKHFRKLEFFFSLKFETFVMGAVRVLSGSLGLRILPSNLTAQVLVVFEI